MAWFDKTWISGFYGTFCMLISLHLLLYIISNVNLNDYSSAFGLSVCLQYINSASWEESRPG